MTRAATRTFAAVFSLLVFCFATDAAALSAAKCAIAKSQTMSKGVTCIVSRRVRILKGASANVTKCSDRIRKAFDKIDARGGCDRTGDAATASARAEGIAQNILDVLHAELALTPDALRCLESQAKQLASYSRCQAEAMTIRLREEYRQDREDFAICVSHLEDEFAALEAELPCASNGDARAAMDEVGGGYGYLPGAQLEYASGSLLMRAELPHADLTGASLHDNALDDANLREADLTNAWLPFAVFERADLRSAVFSGANLFYAVLNESRLEGAELGTASLQYLRACDLDGCPASLPADWVCYDGCLLGPYVGLQNAAAPGMNRDGLNLAHAQGRGVWLQGSSWVGTNLAGAELENVDLTGANMTGADFTGAYMYGTSFVGATLDGADFTSANLDAVLQFDGASLIGVTWNDTECPDGTNSDANGGTCCGHLEGTPSACSP